MGGGTYTWNPADKHPYVVLSNNNLTATISQNNGFGSAVRATDSKTLGKFYFEVALTFSNALFFVAGIMNSVASVSGRVGQDGNSWGYTPAGYFYHNTSTGVPSCASGSVVNVAVDMDAGKVWFGVNGVWITGVPELGTGPAYSDVTGTIFPAASFIATDQIVDLRVRTAQFSYSPPTGFDPYATDLGTLNGTVYEKNSVGVYIPGAYPVRVYRRSDGELVATTTSATDGSYTVDNLKCTTGVGEPEEYYVMAVDNNAPFQKAALVEHVFVTAD